MIKKTWDIKETKKLLKLKTQNNSNEIISKELSKSPRQIVNKIYKLKNANSIKYRWSKHELEAIAVARLENKSYKFPEYLLEILDKSEAQCQNKWNQLINSELNNIDLINTNNTNKYYKWNNERIERLLKLGPSNYFIENSDQGVTLRAVKARYLRLTKKN